MTLTRTDSWAGNSVPCPFLSCQLLLRYYFQVQSHEAKAYLIDQILIEADREKIHLSEVERKMLEFSEAESTPPNFEELNTEFEREYDSDEYEAKIAGLIRNRVAGLRAIHSPDADRWDDAVATLAEEDHYLLVMIRMAESRFPRRRYSTGRPPYDRLKLFATAVLAIAIGMALMSLLRHFGVISSRSR